jgi:hypothetical protein
LSKAYQIYESILAETATAVNPPSGAPTATTPQSGVVVSLSKDPWLYQLQCSQCLAHLKHIHEQFKVRLDKVQQVPTTGD